MYNIQKVTEEDESDLNWIDEAEADVEETHRRHHHQGPLLHLSEEEQIFHSDWNMKIKRLMIIWWACNLCRRQTSIYSCLGEKRGVKIERKKESEFCLLQPPRPTRQLLSINLPTLWWTVEVEYPLHERLLTSAGNL